MKVAVYSAKTYDRRFLEAANERHRHELHYFEPHLDVDTAALARGFEAVCAFVNDDLKADALRQLDDGGVRLIALRCAGFNNVDVKEAERLGMTVARVPAYSPHAVAEHCAALILTLNRKTHRAYNRVREGNFALEGLMGFDLHGRTAGVVGTGKIGIGLVRILRGFGCRVLASDPYPNDECRELGAEYVELDRLFEQADIISLNCPLTPETHHLIDAGALDRMKDGVMIVNTGRGALIDTRAVIDALKGGRIGFLGLDVYEEESELFFEDKSAEVIQDDVFARLLTFPNVLITGHQAFFTREAVANIAETTLSNVTAFEKGEGELHRVHAA